MLIQISLQKRGAATLDSFELSFELSSLGVKHEIFLSSENEIKDKWLALKNIDKNIVWVNTYKNSNFYFLVSLFSFKWLKFLKKLYYDKPEVIIATHFHPWLFFIILIKRKLTKKFIYIVHEDPFNPKEVDNYIMIWLEKFILKRADIILTHSDKILADIKPYINNTEVHSFALGSYLNYFSNIKKTQSTDGIRFLFFGRIEEYKGVDILVQAFTNLRKSNISASLVIAGGGHLSQSILDMNNTNNISILNKWLSSDDIVDILSKTDVIVLPYKKASQSGVLSTAWGVGLPVIISDIEGLKEQVIDRENGLIFKNGDITDLEEKMKILCVDHDLLLKITKGSAYYGREVYTWEKVVIGIKEIILNFK